MRGLWSCPGKQWLWRLCFWCRAVMCCRVTVFESCHFSEVYMWQQVGNNTRATGTKRKWALRFEAMVTGALWPKQSLGYYPNPRRCPSPDPPTFLHTHWDTGPACAEVNWTLFWTPAITPTHRVVSLSIFLWVTRSQAHTDNGSRRSVWHRTGNQCLCGRGAPSCAFPEGRQHRNPGSMCVSEYHLPSKTPTLDFTLPESSLSLHRPLPSHLFFTFIF